MFHYNLAFFSERQLTERCCVPISGCCTLRDFAVKEYQRRRCATCSSVQIGPRSLKSPLPLAGRCTQNSSSSISRLLNLLFSWTVSGSWLVDWKQIARFSWIAIQQVFFLRFIQSFSDGIISCRFTGRWKDVISFFPLPQFKSLKF